MKKALAIGTIFFLLLMVCVVQAAEKGTAKEAQAMVKKAVTYLKANGEEKAFAEFRNPKGKFFNKDLYIYVLNTKGKVLEHAASKALEGKDMINLKDSHGKLFVQEIIGTAQSNGSGWTDYMWSNPKTKKLSPKSSYFEKVGDLIVICGFYK